MKSLQLMNNHEKELFEKKTIEKWSKKTHVSQEQMEIAHKWIDWLEKGELEDETKNYLKFANNILDKILGFPIDDIKHNEDNEEFQFTDSSGVKILGIEAKGTKTKDLFKIQHGYKKEHETPIKQTWNYMGENALEYGICTNYRHFVLITKTFMLKKYHIFDFLSIKENPKKLEEFITIFSKTQIIEKGFVETLHDESVQVQKDISDEFYKIFHQTRLMLIESFKHNDEVSDNDAFYYSQIFLDRLIFIYFVSDQKFFKHPTLFSDIVNEQLSSAHFHEHSMSVFSAINSLFKAFGNGSEDMDIFRFNGNFFTGALPPKIYFLDNMPPDSFVDILDNIKISKKINLNEKTETNIQKCGTKLNPLIKNLLIMDSYDFNTDVNVNILGHIFEQSISDLDDYKKTGDSHRKKDGIYYTPEYITDYICRNTIIPHLSKSNSVTSHDLIFEYSENIDELITKFKNIRILDPACGSGAFLLKSVDILLEIYYEIQNYKESIGKYTSKDNTTLDKDIEETVIKEIIEHNIFGVDINRESVEITKLGLFLKLATSERKLADTKNIIVGNSLLTKKKDHEQAFEWSDVLPHVFHDPLLLKNKDEFVNLEEDGFDVVVGNPPYFNMDTLGANSPYANSIKKNYPKVWNDKTDILIYFITKSLELSKNKLGFIISNAFLFSDKADKFRNYLLENSSINKIINFEKFYVFKDADITTSIIFLDKDDTKTNTRALVLPKKMYDESQLERIFADDRLLFDVQLKKDSVFALVNDKIDKINTKIDAAGKPLGDLFKVGSGMQTALNSVFVMSTPPTDFPPNFIKKRISGDIIRPYYIGDTNEYLLYVENTESFNDLPQKIQEYLNLHKDDLSNRADKKRRKSAKWWNYAFSMHKELYHMDKIWCSYRREDNCFVYDNTEEYVGLTNTTVIFGTNENISLQYIIALLNSTLLNFRYRSIGKQTGGGLYEYFENGVSKLPIPEINLEEQEVFITKSSKIMKYYSEFYDKQKKFITRLITNYNIKINSQLDLFYEMDFEDFYKELSKQKIDISNEQQEDLENYFKDRKRTLFNLQGKISLILDEIDVLVFKLYGISKEDQEIIRANLDK